MVTVDQALRPPASLSLLFNHGTFFNSAILRSWRQTSGGNSLKLWLLVVVVKTTEEKAEPPGVRSSCVAFSCINHHPLLELLPRCCIGLVTFRNMVHNFIVPQNPPWLSPDVYPSQYGWSCRTIYNLCSFISIFRILLVVQNSPCI